MTTERVNFVPKLVGLGKPFHFGISGSVIAVYDEHGRPWLLLDNEKRLCALLKTTCSLAGFPLCEGAYVPHSQDNERFMREILPLYCAP